MNKIEAILFIFEKAININFHWKFINEELTKDYNYDFFFENSDIICKNISICFTVENLNILLNGLKSFNIFHEPYKRKTK